MTALILTLAMALLGVVIAERPTRIRLSVLLLFIAAAAQRRGLQPHHPGDLGGATMPYFSLVLMGGSGIIQRGVQSQRHGWSAAWRSNSSAGDPATWDQREDLIKDGRFAGREQWVTVLISDTCSFTGLSEQLPRPA